MLKKSLETDKILSLVKDIEFYGVESQNFYDYFAQTLKNGNISEMEIRKIKDFIAAKSFDIKKISEIPLYNTTGIAIKIFEALKKFRFCGSMTSFPSRQEIGDFLTELNKTDEIEKLLPEVFTSDIIICDCMEKSLSSHYRQRKDACIGNLLRFVRYIVSFSLFSDSDKLFEACAMLSENMNSFSCSNFKRITNPKTKEIGNFIAAKLKNHFSLPPIENSAPRKNSIVFTEKELAFCKFY